MAVPKRRTSKAKKRMRRAHIKLHVPGMVECPDCGEMKPPCLPGMWLLQNNERW